MAKKKVAKKAAPKKAAPKKAAKRAVKKAAVANIRAVRGLICNPPCRDGFRCARVRQDDGSFKKQCVPIG